MSKANPKFVSRLAALILVASAASSAHAANEAKAQFEARRDALANVTKSLQMQDTSDIIFTNDFDVQPASCTADRDADRLADCVETGTGKFVDRQNTGTSPDSADTDGDGLLDGDEVLGTAEGLALPTLGVSPVRRDLLLEYDWFELQAECGALSHRPTGAALQRVTELFASSPLQNPDGTTGIHVIHDYGQGGAFTGGNRIDGYSATLPGTFDETYHAIKRANFDAKRLGYFHYVMMAHRYNGGSDSSGWAEVIGDDVIVSLYCLNSDANVGATIAHELGHNLGLEHGGFEGCNGKPNYNSIMNYRYQFEGIDTSCAARGSSVVGFSNGDRLPLDENNLNEPLGVCGSLPIDWNGNGNLESGLALDVNVAYAASCGGDKTTLEDFDDWRNLTFAGLLDKHMLLKSVKREVGCAGAPVPGKK